jgi:putative addiction module killer protein
MKEIKKYIIEELEDDNGVNRYRNFFRKLGSSIIKSKILLRLQRVSNGNLGDYKDLKDGVFELKVSGTGPGYRIYFSKHENRIIILILGGDKKTQKKDIKQAKNLWQNLKYRYEQK